ncbi:unnamed protein product, partial [Onchocerca flexuosa]|uniref:Ovule protein n=1 Tax=Onchocerca flexuosa TaxID=387005 RepID=A0A183HVN0_9BILA
RDVFTVRSLIIAPYTQKETSHSQPQEGKKTIQHYCTAQPGTAHTETTNETLLLCKQIKIFFKNEKKR